MTPPTPVETPENAGESPPNVDARGRPGPRDMRRHRWRGGRPPLAWILARGIHRTLVTFLLVAALLGAGAGFAMHVASVGGPGFGMVCLALAIFGTLWPLSWMASMRIAWPLQRLATVAGDLRDGALQSRDQLGSDGADGPPEVGEVAGVLRGMADRVARQLKDQRALMAAVSHELRSPLGRARVLIEMAREGSAPANFHDELQAEIDAMDGLVGDLLAAARIDFEAVAPREIPAADLARRAVETARLPPETFDPGPTPESGSVRADPTLLARALGTLLDNAQRYGGNTIRLRLRGRLLRVRFEVEDDGPGFAPGDEIRAFEPFWRGPEGRSGRPRGEGLGLALVRQIAEAHGGEAGAENRKEGGARVWIELARA